MEARKDARGEKKFWIELTSDFFERNDIKIIESVDNGKEYVLLYIKLLSLSVKNNGELLINNTQPYNADLLAVITHTNKDIVRNAILFFKSLGLMEELSNGVLYMSKINDFIGYHTIWAKDKREQRKKTIEITKEVLSNKYPYKLGNMEVLSKSLVRFKNGLVRAVDEKRYGGNGKIVLARSNGKCEHCGVEATKEDMLLIHHHNGYSNKQKDLFVLCNSCHGKFHSFDFKNKQQKDESGANL